MLTYPLTLHFEVTDHCNNSCPHCYASSWIQSPAKRPAKRAKPNIIELARRIVDSDVFDVVITGGEPLILGIDRLSELFKFFNDNNVQYSLNTNGRLLSQATCKELKDAGLQSVLISLHSWVDELHNEIVNAPNAAGETKNGIQNALNQGLRVAVNQVIDNRNIDMMYASSAELERMGVHQISFTRALSPMKVGYKVDTINAARFLDEFLKCKESLTVSVVSLLPIPFCADPRVKDLDVKLSCSGGISSAVLSCYGDVRFCPHDSHVWGNVFEEGFDTIWKRISEWREDLAAPAECNDCSFVVDCRGACRVASKLYSDDYAAMDPWARHSVKNYRRKVLYSEFDPDCSYRLSSDIRWRKENEAFLLYFGADHLLVNLDGVEFIRRLPQEFVPSELLSATEENREAHFQFLNALYHNGLLVNKGKL
ncbi:radical SAM/SPASM domain-containing protein [Clostridium sp. Marseille-Q7071]